jgi:O-antigen/teichoic acid export membrane protein
VRSPERAEAIAGPASARQVTTNGFWLLLAYVVPRIGQWIAVLAVARVVGTERFGWYGTAASLAVIASVTTTLGLMPLLIRDISRDPTRAPSVLRAAHLLKTWTNLGMLGALGIAVWALEYPAPVAASALLLGVGYAFGSYAENLGAYFQAVERMRIWMQAHAVLGLVTGTVGVALVATTGSVVAFCGAVALGQAAALAWLLKQAPARRATPAVSVWRLMHGAAPFAVAFVALTIFYKVDVLIVDMLRGPHAAGVYTAAYKFIDVTHALTLVGIGAVYPRLSRLLQREGRRGTRTGARLVELSTLATVLWAGALSLGASWIVPVAFGADYRAAADVLALLALAIPFLAINLLAGYLLAARNRMARAGIAYILGLAVKVTANVFAVGRWGPVGAAGAMVCAEVLTAGMLLGVLGAAEQIRPRMRALAVPAVALATAAFLAGRGIAGPVPAMGFVIVVLMLYKVIGALTVDERGLLKGLLTPRAPLAGEASR